MADVVSPGPGVDPAAAVDRLLTQLTRFLLRNSAEGAFELRDTVREVGAAYGARADVLAITEGAVLSVDHPSGAQYTATVHVAPELARLDLVTEAKRLVNRMVSGTLSAELGEHELTQLEQRPQPYPAWLRLLGVVLFAAGFAPSAQATWRELLSSLLLGAVMGLLFIGVEQVPRLRPLLPIVGPIVVGIVAFRVLHAHHAPGGPVILMVPALFVLIPGDFLCAATVEIAVGQITPGAVRLAQAAFTLVELAAGVAIAADISNVGTRSLFESSVPPELPYWLVALSWIPFSVGLVWTFSARLRDLGWILLFVYLAWGSQEGATRLVGPVAGTFLAGTVLALAAGLLARSLARPPRIVVILGGFFALTVGALALRGLAVIDGGQRVQGFNDLRDAVAQTAALTLGLVVGSVAAAAPLPRIRARSPVS
ncbi:MAG: threonine/serine exporter ThrE family protein [Streptosporangiaceae bacterium]